MIIKKTVGELINYVDERNIDSSIMDFYGININKEFMPTVANIDTVDPKNIKLYEKTDSYLVECKQVGIRLSGLDCLIGKIQ